MDVKSHLHRILYSFGINKFFLPIKRYARRPTELTPERLKEYVLSAFRGPKKKEVKAKQKPSESRPPSFLITFAYTIGLMIAIVVLYTLFTSYIMPSLQHRAVPPAVAAEVSIPSPIITLDVNNSGFADAFDATKWWAIIGLSVSNASVTNVSLYAMQDPVPENIFVLRTRYISATSYDEFYKELKKQLTNRGLIISEITVDDLLRMPKSMHAVILVPSGNMPAVFVGMEDPSFDMKKFTEQGNVIFYIGNAPTEGVLKKDIPFPQTISEETMINRFGLEFPKDATAPSRFKFTVALYGVQGRITENIAATVRSVPGEASVTWGGGGYVYFIPTTLDTWWSFSGKETSNEIAEALASAYWGVHFARADLNLNSTDGLNDQMMGLFTQDLKTKGEPIKTAYGRLIVRAENTSDNRSSVSGKTFNIEFPDRPLGSITNPVEFISTALTDEPVDLAYSLNESSTELKMLYLSVLNSSGAEVNFIPISSEPKPLRISRDSYRFNALLPSGEYILRITDANRSVFAQSYLKIPEFRVKPYLRDWARGFFVFNVYLDGEERPYAGKLNNIKLSFDGREEKDLQLVMGQVSYNISFLPTVGPHIFNFVFGKDNLPFSMPYERETMFYEKPEYLIMGTISLVLFGAGMLLRRPEEIIYTIDVPDFPPLHAIAVPVKREVVLDVFENANKELRWQYTPLSLQDLKIGFKKVLNRGRPLAVGDYNLERILDKLIEEGRVEHALDYYGPKEWESKTNKSIHYLAMLRALRDAFVINGIPFVPFGQRTDCDTLLSVTGENVYVHIYENESVISRAIVTAGMGRTIIVFEDESIMKDFTNRIHSASETNVTFKILLDAGKINITPINRMMDVINKRFTFYYY